MESFSLELRPLMIVQFLFGGLVMAAAIMVATDRYIHATIREYWRYMAIGILVTLAWRLPQTGAFFHGMEYEDAYVYTVAARQILQGTNLSEPGGTHLITVCDVGSLDECQSTTTYSGHYIGGPYVFSLAARILGYRPAIAAWVGVAASCVTLLLVFFIGRMLSDEPTVPIFSAAGFAMTPVFAVHGVASYVEPLSNLCTSIAVLAWLRYLHSDPAERRTVSDLAALCTWGFALLFAIVVKRENLMLAFALPVAHLARIVVRGEPNPLWRRIAATSLFSGVAIAFSVFALRFAEVLRNEAAEYRHIPFGLSQVSSLLPAFAISFGVPAWYCLGLAWVLYSIALTHRTKYRTLYPLLLILGYLSLYVSHIRSYYQLNYGDVMPSDALRYSMNFMTMWALLVGLGLAFGVTTIFSCTVGRRWRSVTVVAVIAAFVIYAAVAYRYTRSLHEQVTSEEQNRRIEPAIMAAQLAVEMGAARTYILTLEPLIVQMYCAPNVNVIELTRMSSQLVASLTSTNSGFTLIYIDHETYRNEIDQNRYRAPLEFLKGFKRESLYQGDQFEIVRLNPPPL